MNDDKLKTIAFTGRIQAGREEPAGLITAAIIHFYLQGYRIFLSGMNEGFDMLAADEVLKMKIHYPDIRLHCIIPFAGQPDGMGPQDKSRYGSILVAADTIIYLSLGYSEEYFLKQSDYLLENSSQLIAYYDHIPKGGAYYMVKHAAERNIPVFNLHEKQLEYFDFYQDELVTGWGRASFNVRGLSCEQAVESIRLLDFEDVAEIEDHPFITFESYEYLPETFIRVSLKENEGQATIEILHGDSLKPPVFSNADSKMAEEKVYTLHMLASHLAEWRITDVFKMLPAELRDRNNPEQYAEVYRERYDEYFKSYLEQLSNL